MVKFRRSMKGEEKGKPKSISIPPKDAIAIVPPKKVIKALYDYQAPNAVEYLSFTAGDFLHVVGRENDPDWYEACNPLHGTRGLVPVKYFEGVGKTVRDSGESTGSLGSGQPSAGHDSGYAEKTGGSIGSNGTDSSERGMRFSKTMKGTGAMVYGIVMYDFKAERPDELEAKEGEAIIVIAQSNPEWFVAKPITRLGGPGLIPVSFIEIRDMGTGQAVPDAQEAVQRAGVPKVEEWKKMAADYKSSSIPLGKLEGQQSMQQGMERMSLGNKSDSGYAQNGYGPASARGHSRHNSAYDNRPQTRQSGPRLLSPTKASVPRYCFADEIFWFIVEAEMEDGRHWELSRLYQDFYDLQINLIQEFPLEAGNVKGYERTLPYMPGPVTYVTDNISNGRRANLDDYIKNLLKLGPHITSCQLVRRFFAPREGDYEIDPNVQDGYRLSTGSATDVSGPSNGSSAGNLASPSAYAVGSPYGNPAHQRNQPSYSSQQTAMPGQYPNDGLAPPFDRRITTTSNSSAGTAPPSSGALKIKVWFEADNCVVIRMPMYFSYADLYKKLRERRALERPAEMDLDLLVEYRDEAEGTYFPLETDEDLRIALERNPKLTLGVRVMR